MKPIRINWIGFSIIFFMVAFCRPVSTDAKTNSNADQEEFKQIHEFLNFIKFSNTPSGGFNAQEAPHWDLVKFISFLSSQGVTFTDINFESNIHYSISQIKSEISKRKGNAFKTFSHLAHIYSQPYKQYSELTFEKKVKMIAVSVADWYVLTFTSENGRWHLIKCEYVMLEGE